MGMQLIETIEVGSGGAASIEFTGIPQDGVDLLVVLSGRNSSTGRAVYLTVNGSTTGFSGIYLRGDGSATGSGTATNAQMEQIPGSAYTSNTFGNATFYISNYTSGSAKSFSSDTVTENNATNSIQEIWAQSWTGNSAITSVKLAPANSFVQYSTASLYKITAD